MVRRVLPTIIALTAMLFVLAPLPCAGAEWTPELMLKLKSVGSVQVSPDGRRVLYTAREAITEGEKSQYLTHIHVANIDGSDPFQLTYGDKSASEPAWSPDGKWIAFISDRSGKDNVWIIRTSGGEAQQLTEVKSRVIAFKWSPDSRFIAYTSPDPPTEAEEKAKKEKNDAEVLDENLKMVRLWVIPIAATGKREARKLTEGSYSVSGRSRDFDWSPDGKEIAFVHTPTPKFNDWIKTDISVVEVATGKVRPLVASRAAESSPLYSPDGKSIAYEASDDPPTWGFTSTIQIIPADGGAPRQLGATFDQQPSLVDWSADGKGIYYTEAEGTVRRIYYLPADGGPYRAVSGQELNIGDVNLNHTRTWFGFSGQTVDKPVEAYVARPEDFKPVRFSQVNQELAGLPIGRTEAIRWRSTDGLEIEGLLTYPVGYQPGKRYPLLLVIHGGPAGVFTRTFLGNPGVYPLAIFAECGYAVLRANIRGSSGYGRNFRYANYQDWGGMDYKDLMAGVDHVIAMGVADPERLGVMGWSYGGFMTSWVITQTKRFKAASVGAGVTNLISFTGTADIPDFLPDYFKAEFWDNLEIYRAHSPVLNVKGVSTPTLIQHGERDERVPLSQGLELYNALKRQGCTVKMVVYPRTPHGPREPKLLLDVMRRNLEWFDKYVRGAEQEAAGAN